MKFGLIIPTLNAGAQFEKLLTQLAAQTLPTKKLIVDSESTDGTARLAKNFGLEVLTIPRKSFNHGATRQFALEKILPLDVIIFLTQDVLLHDDDSLARLVKIFSEDESVGLSYGRQLPHVDATNEAKFLRAFNYPPESQLRSFDDRKIFGLKTAFASNSFAAYRVESLQSVGGFPSNVPLCEDMFVAAKMLMSGLKIFYAADAKVFHSHNYTAAQEFRRYVQIGKFHAQESWIRETFGSAEGAGKKFVLMKLSALAKKNPVECFGALFRDAAKFFGYRVGRLSI
ncbi:MAG: glycosyltransferase family 2 protein [Selenomonadaceae bacterium]|nr:glycosyltransferase family 2 protein [Selenomonadaceae bacterium]MBQ9497941.1 glycosyltransferase family 2 protein [Selenomonadaceae bacterium]